MDAYPKRTNEPEAVDHEVSFVGGTNAVTKVAGTGLGVVINYISTGVVDLVWNEPPGNFAGFLFGFQATTQAQVKGYTCVAGVPSYSSATGKTTLRINIFDSTFALANLTAAQWAHLRVGWKRASTAIG